MLTVDKNIYEIHSVLFFVSLEVTPVLLEMCWDLQLCNWETNEVQVVGLHAEQRCSGKVAPVSAEPLLLKPQSASAHYCTLLHGPGKSINPFTFWLSHAYPLCRNVESLWRGRFCAPLWGPVAFLVFFCTYLSSESCSLTCAMCRCRAQRCAGTARECLGLEEHKFDVRLPSSYISRVFCN